MPKEPTTRVSTLIPPVRISKITVKKLFGYFDYEIKCAEPSPENRVMLLYGENGSGKTTILSILYHLLQPVPYEGHKSFIATRPFKLFSVQFSDGSNVTAERKGSTLTGGYHSSIVREGRKRIDFRFETDEQTGIKEESLEFLEELGRIKANVNLLPDNRWLQLGISGPISGDIEALVDGDAPTRILRKQKNIARREALERVERQTIEHAVARFSDWLRESVIAANKHGSEDVNQIYGRLVNDLIESPSSRINKAGVLERLDKYKTRLNHIALESGDLSALGLAPKFDPRPFLKNIRQAKANERAGAQIVDALAPYIAALEARIRALNTTLTRVNSVLEVLNAFFSRKKVTFDLEKGFEIRSPLDAPLSMGELSSGERQLFLQLCHVAASPAGSRVFLIDEPELSLNVKWQRGLIDALLRCSGEDTQFIFASHSIELLAKHSKSVARLPA